MEKQNELILKLIANEAIEENDELFLQEIECANNDPAFANNDISRKKIEKVIDDSIKKSKRKSRKKIAVRVASVFLALLIGLSAVTLTVKGFREKLWEFLSNIGNPSYSLFITSNDKNENKFAEYEGQYIPTWIPDGYEITDVNNQTTVNTITFQNSLDQFIYYSEHPKEYESKLNLDKEDFDSYEVKTVVGKEIVIATKNESTTLVVKETGAVILVMFNDVGIDIVGFAELIEQK